MSPLPSIASAGLALLDRGERQLAASARGFTRATDAGGASTADRAGSNAPATPESDLVDSAVGVIYGRTAFEIGLRLLAVGRDTEKSLVDLLA